MTSEEAEMRPLRPVLFVAVLIAMTGCGGSEPPAAPVAKAPALDLARLELVDLSHTFDETTIYWPTSPTAFEHEELNYGDTPAGFFYSSYQLSTPEHGGTHLDAPIHFARERWTADEIPLDRLVAPAIVIDVAAKAAEDPDYRLTREDVLDWEAKHGQVDAGTIVILRTGWFEKWHDRTSYLGDDTPGDASNLHFPSYGEDSARLLVEERNVAVLGVDTASIDYGPSADFIVHQIANGANVAGFENLANLGGLPARGFWVAALPMKVGQGSGGPLRAIALLER
jgi:kynurenine formamidase